jgi:TRAP-type C4-dicarboxylate transport system permease small subunit
MEALGQLLAAIAAFILEMTIHAAVSLFHLVMAIFSPRYRQKLKDEWAESTWKRCGIVSSAIVYSAALMFALVFWIPILLRPTPEAADEGRKPPITIQFSPDDVERMKKTKEIEGLTDVAQDILRRRLEERKREER